MTPEWNLLIVSSSQRATRRARELGNRTHDTKSLLLVDPMALENQSQAADRSFKKMLWTSRKIGEVVSRGRGVE